MSGAEARHTRRGGLVADTPLRFPGQYADRETGFHYNLFRYCMPQTGRYTAPDPLGLHPAGDPFGYVLNPLVWLDPLGLVPGYGDLGDDWVPLDVTANVNWNGCEDLAVRIQERLGGGRRFRIENSMNEPRRDYPLGPYRGVEPVWFHHDVVVFEERVYDGFTGRDGLSRADYDALWSPDYLDILNWRPLE